MKQFLGIILICLSVSSLGQGLPKMSLNVLSESDKIRDSVAELRSNFSTLGIEDRESQLKELRKFKKDNWVKVKHFSIYGGGALESLISGRNSDSINESTSTTGNIGFIIVTNRVSCDITYSYNGKEVVQMNSLGQFGSSLLNPKLSGQSFSVSIVSRLYESVGLFGNLQVSNNIWETDSSTSIAASPIICRLGLCWNPFDFQSDKYALTINANYTHRSILGDYNNNSQIIDGFVIEPRGYNGFDASVNFYLNSIRFVFQYSQNLDGKLERSDAESITIPGFTGGQVTIGIVISGNVINLMGSED